MLSTHAQGDAHRLLGQFASLLIFISVALALPAIFGKPGAAGGHITQHLLIATTMLIVGIFAVLSWDSTFPDRRDVLVLSPLPVQPRTMFLANGAAVATALILTIALLHSLTGLAWPLAFAAQAKPAVLPALTFDPTPNPIPIQKIQSVIDRDLPQPVAAGIAIGVWQHGQQRVFTYGDARPDSLFEIGSISKTFTGLLLARMVAEGKTTFDEPVRQLLPPGTVAKPQGPEITLLDLATHRSGLPRMPRNFRPADRTNPYADYGPKQLYAYLAKKGVARPADATFQYSNLGLGLLGQALAERAGKPYPELLRDEITSAIGMPNTAIQLDPDQQRRFLQGHNEKNAPVHAWDLDALAGAGAIRSTAGDMLNYLAANLHPENHPALTNAFAASQRLRANAGGDAQIALAWTYSAENGTYQHAGATAGFTSYALFHPQADFALIVLMNTGPSLLLSPGQIGEHIRQRLTGQPAVSLATVTVPAQQGLLAVPRSLFAYWFTMLAAGFFVFGLVLGLQALAAQLLPRRVFLRLSGYLQLAAFCGIVCVYFLQPGLGGLEDLGAAGLWRVFQWLPSYWFLGLYQQLNGTAHPALDLLATRAWIGLAVVLAGTTAAYALSYWRTLRQIVEEPDIAPGIRRWSWLPRFGNSQQTAIGQFAVRTLVRSRQHRMILAFYFSVGLAFTSLVLKDPSTRRQFEDSVALDPWREASAALWMASVMMMLLAAIGTRVVYALPLDLRANWVFRLAGVRNGPLSLAAARRALLVLAVLPVWLAEAVVCTWFWPSWQTAVHLTALALLGLILADLCLIRLRKIPFACGFLPGKSRFTIVFLCAIALVHGTIRAVLLERQALLSTRDTAGLLVSLLALWAASRWTAQSLAKREEPDIQYEDELPPAVQELGLSRDGAFAISATTPLT